HQGRRRKVMSTNAELYEDDFYSWTQTTAALIRAGKWHDLAPDAVAEEVESLGRSEKRELEHRLEVLVMHLLKWRYQPTYRDQSHSCYATILAKRSQPPLLLRDNPSLRSQVPPLLVDIYPAARRRAMGETRLDTGRFPVTCPWQADQVLNAEFWP